VSCAWTGYNTSDRRERVQHNPSMEECKPHAMTSVGFKTRSQLLL
jgi:hypothetical protein